MGSKWLEENRGDGVGSLEASMLTQLELMSMGRCRHQCSKLDRQEREREEYIQ